MAKKAAASKRYTPPKVVEPEAPLVVSTAEDWDDVGVLLPLPSGKVVRCARPKGLSAFLTGGNIPNSLLPFLNDAMDGKAPEANALAEILKNPKGLEDIMAMADSIVVECVLEPPVRHPPKEGSDRNRGVVYTDKMTDDDKMFIMQFAMSGAKDLETFRREQAATVDAMANVQGVPDPSESTPED